GIWRAAAGRCRPGLYADADDVVGFQRRIVGPFRGDVAVAELDVLLVLVTRAADDLDVGVGHAFVQPAGGGDGLAQGDSASRRALGRGRRAVAVHVVFAGDRRRDVDQVPALQVDILHLSIQ